MDVWKIGVAISLTNGMSPVLAVIAADLLGLKGKVGEVEKAFSGWNVALGGTVAILAGTAIVAGVAKLAEHGKELVHVQEQMRAAGVNQVDIAKATGDSWKVAADYGLRVSNVLADIKEARMVFGSTEHAMDFIDPLERMRVVLNASMEGSGNKAADAVYEMARAGELKGLQTPDQFMSYFDQMTKAITASGGKIDPKSFLQATQYGRLASKGWDEEFYTKFLPSMIQEMGPSQSGTALMSLFGTLGQGKVSKRSLGQMIDIGLIEDQSKIIYDGKGDPVGFNPGAVKGTDLLTKNPYEWAQQVFKPLIEAKLGHEVRPSDESAIQALGGMFGNRTAAQAIATLLLENQRISKDAGLVGQARGLGAADDLLKIDPDTATRNFKNSWDNLLTSLGSPLVPMAVSAMNSIADVMKSLTQFANGHPETIKIIGVALVGLGAGLAALGAVAVVSAAVALAPTGAIIAAIVAIGSIITAIAAYKWEDIKNAFTNINKALTDFATKIINVGWQKIVDIFNGIYSAIVNFITQIAQIPAMIKNAVLGGPGVGEPGSANAPGTPQFKIDVPGYHPSKDELPNASGWVPHANATLQAQVNTTVPLTVNVDGTKVADAVLPKIEQRLETMFSRMANSLMDGRHNDIGSHLSPGSVGAN